MVDITISDVAAQAGVSIRTVSRVLNESPYVNVDTRARVRATIEALQFRPSAKARGLVTGRSYLIGLLHNDRNALVLDGVQRGAGEEAGRRGYELLLHPSPAQEPEVLADTLAFIRRSRVDGVLVLPPVSGVVGLGAALSSAGIQAVGVSSVRLDDFPVILISRERAGAALAADHLAALGHRRLGLLSGPADTHSARERRSGFVERLSTLGCELVAEVEGDYGFDSGVAGAQALLDRLDPPTAVFAANDVMAAGVLKVAASRGIRVPERLSVVGFDNSILARMLSPALTSIYRPMQEMANRSAACLLDMIEGGEPATDLASDMVLVPGDSSGPAPD